MADHRSHSDIALASLILVGTLLLIAGIAAQAFEPPGVVKGILWFVAAFVAAHVARRVLADLAIDEIAIAAAVTIALVVGIWYQRTHQPISVQMLIPIGVAEAGALAGAFTSRCREPLVRGSAASPVARGWLIAAAGLGGFGAGILAAGVAILAGASSGWVGLTSLAGAFVGGALISMFTPARPLHSALGQAAAFGCLLAASETNRLEGAPVGIVIGFFIGAASSAIGTRLRPRMRREFPEARVKDS